MRFAKLDENNIVTDVVNADSVEWLEKTFGGVWEESPNSNDSGRPAAIGGAYDPENNVFINPKPYPSWVLDENLDWVAPLPPPTNVYTFDWNEQAQDWFIISTPPPSDGDYLWDEDAGDWVATDATL